jgi:NOL1/NOP2/fmu family ribosome biogenesis protein
LSLRQASRDEETEVLAFFEGLEGGLADRVAGRNQVAVVERDGIAFANLATPEVLALPPELVAGSEGGGLAIGVLEDDRFHLDLQGAVLAARHTKRQTIRVTEHAARLFLYGRNVLAESVDWADPGLEKGDACIVCNPRGEAMGLGIVHGSLKGKGEAVKPVQDLGTYLRDQDEGE